MAITPEAGTGVGPGKLSPETHILPTSRERFRGLILGEEVAAQGWTFPRSICNGASECPSGRYSSQIPGSQTDPALMFSERKTLGPRGPSGRLLSLFIWGSAIE